MKTIFYLWCSSFIFCYAYSQSDATQQVMQEMKNLSARYNTADHLKFDMLYRYSDETKPGVFLDSLIGSCKMNRNQYWSQLDSTEFIGAESENVTLFKEDRIMYLTRVTKENRINTPTGLPDSLFLQKNMKVSFEDRKEDKKISIDYQPGSVCKRAEYYIDKRSGFISRMVSVVKSSSMYDHSVSGQMDDGSYVVVEVVYSNYAERSFIDAEISTSKFFRKEGDQYMTVAPYEGYKIFFGSARY